MQRCRLCVYYSIKAAESQDGMMYRLRRCDVMLRIVMFAHYADRRNITVRRTTSRRKAHHLPVRANIVPKQKSTAFAELFVLVPVTGIEPVRVIHPRDFKSRASASSATPACDKLYFNTALQFCQSISRRFISSIDRHFLLCSSSSAIRPFIIHGASPSVIFIRFSGSAKLWMQGSRPLPRILC